MRRRPSTANGNKYAICAGVLSSDIRERPGEKMNWSKYFTCDPIIGVLYWKAKPVDGDDPKGLIKGWNTRYAGRPAGCIRTDGYLAVGIEELKRKIKVHRIIWEMINGPIPSGLVVDHINRTRADNRIENLRVITSRENFLNSPRFDGRPPPPVRQPRTLTSKSSRTNSATMKGTYKVKKKLSKPWSARIWVGGKVLHIGYYATEL